MELKIDLNQIRNDFTNAFGQLATTLGNWKGRIMTLLNSGSEKVAPYFQDKRIAAVSLVALNVLLFGICENLLPVVHDGLFDGKEGIIPGLLTCSISLMPSILGVIAFTKYTQLALSPLQVTIISVSTFVISAHFS